MAKSLRASAASGLACSMRIVHAGDQDVFKREHPAFLSLVFLARGDEFLERILRFTGMILLRTSSVAPWSEIARRNCIGSAASRRICGARPLVEIVIFRAPMPPPHGAFRMRNALSK